MTDPDDQDDDNTGTLLIALMQKNGRKKKREGEDLLTIGYAIYQVIIIISALSKYIIFIQIAYGQKKTTRNTREYIQLLFNNGQTTKQVAKVYRTNMKYVIVEGLETSVEGASRGKTSNQKA